MLLRFGTPFIDCYAAYTLGWTTIDANAYTYPPKYDRRHAINLLTTINLYKQLYASLRWEFGSGVPTTETVGYYDRIQLPSPYVPSFADLTGEPYTMLGQKNAARLPAYHRMDLSIGYRFTLSFIRGSVGFNVTNVYDQKNIFYFDRKTGHQIDQLPFYPSIALDLEY